MTGTQPLVVKHHATAREHLAGIKAAQAFQQDLMARQLLDSQYPIRDWPITTPPQEG